jgi:hypothetical protein
LKVAPRLTDFDEVSPAYQRFRQIFGKMDFDGNSPDQGKVLITAYLLMVGLGGLEPSTSPLSGAFMVLYA